MSNEQEPPVNLASEQISHAVYGTSPESRGSLRSQRKFRFIASVYGVTIAAIILTSLACNNSESSGAGVYPTSTIVVKTPDMPTSLSTIAATLTKTHTHTPTYTPSPTPAEVPLVHVPGDTNGDNIIDMLDYRVENGPDKPQLYDRNGQRGGDGKFSVDQPDVDASEGDVCTLPVSQSALHRFDHTGDGHILREDVEMAENHMGVYDDDSGPDTVPIDFLWRGIPVVDGKPDLENVPGQTDASRPDPFCDTDKAA